jgi:RNA polymerase sigma-70 factor (ECF subfamily)
VADHPDPAELGTASARPRPAHAPTPQPTASDHAEFAAFYRASFPGLVAFLLYHGASLADAAELAQDTMIEAFRSWPTITTPKAWVRTVAGRKYARRLSSVEETPTTDIPEPTPLLRAMPPTDESEQRREIVRLLRLLPLRQRQVMAWTFDGYTPTEIAPILGLDPAAIRQTLRKARTALAADLDAHRGEDTSDA